MFNMLVHSTELGLPPKLDNIHNSFSVDSKHPIEHVWDWTATCSDRNGRIDHLLIAAHGRYTELDTSGHQVGGFGISLGTGLYRSNVYLFRKLAGKVSNIYLFVCGGAARTENLEQNAKGEPMSSPYGQSHNPDYVNNNWQLCKDMAAYAEAAVYASPDKQVFETGRWSGRFNFGIWEGTILRFSQYGEIQNVTSRMHKFGEETGDE